MRKKTFLDRIAQWHISTLERLTFECEKKTLLDRIARWYMSTLERLTFEYEKKKLCRVLGSC